MKVKVLRSLPDDVPAVKVGALAGLIVEPAGLTLGPPADHRPWSALLAISLFRRADDDQLLLIWTTGDPGWVSLGGISDASSGRAIGAPNPGALIRSLCRHRPGLAIDRMTYETLRGTPPAQLDGAVGAHAAALLAALDKLEGQASDDEASSPSPPRSSSAPAVAEAEPSPSITCPHCGFDQDPGEKCVRCGALFAKLAMTGMPAMAAPKSHAHPLFRPPPGVEIEAASRWGTAFLGADAVVERVLAVLDQHARPLLAINCTVVLLGILGVLGALSLLTGVWAAALAMLVAVATWVATSLSATAFADAVVESRPDGPTAAIRKAWRRMPIALLHRLSATVHIVLGLAALVVPGVVFAVRYSFLETLYAAEPGETAPVVSRGQVSRNLADGFSRSLFALLAAADLVGLFVLAFPIYITGLAVALGLIEAPAWPPTVGMLTLAVPLFAILGGFVFTARAIGRYFLYRELVDQQGHGVFSARDGLSGVTKLTFLFDFGLLILILIRAASL